MPEMPDNILMQIGVGGILVVLVLREVFGFLERTGRIRTANGNGRCGFTAEDSDVLRSSRRRQEIVEKAVARLCHEEIARRDMEATRHREQIAALGRIENKIQP